MSHDFCPRKVPFLFQSCPPRPAPQSDHQQRQWKPRVRGASPGHWQPGERATGVTIRGGGAFSVLMASCRGVHLPKGRCFCNPSPQGEGLRCYPQVLSHAGGTVAGTQWGCRPRSQPRARRPSLETQRRNCHRSPRGVSVRWDSCNEPPQTRRVAKESVSASPVLGVSYQTAPNSPVEPLIPPTSPHSKAPRTPAASAPREPTLITHLLTANGLKRVLLSLSDCKVDSKVKKPKVGKVKQRA